MRKEHEKVVLGKEKPKVIFEIPPEISELFYKYGLRGKTYEDGFFIQSKFRKREKSKYGHYISAVLVVLSLVLIPFVGIAPLVVVIVKLGVAYSRADDAALKFTDQQVMVTDTQIACLRDEIRHQADKEDIVKIEVRTSHINNMGVIYAVKNNDRFPVLRLFGNSEGELKQDMGEIISLFEKMGYKA